MGIILATIYLDRPWLRIYRNDGVIKTVVKGPRHANNVIESAIAPALRRLVPVDKRDLSGCRRRFPHGSKQAPRDSCS